ncbi:MAG: phosphatase PAP2/dual specificity phosphatase family protein [Planctomycetia bacterium]|nr:phosphatase PAP2/dual specificity phosphatase family protein [Planctomycetia bacterium]
MGMTAAATEDVVSSASAERAELRPLALVVSVGLSVLFLVVYSGTNWLTSLRSGVGTWRYAWEDSIPFVPWMIVPYMSIDLFFVIAPFLCRSRAELQIFASQIALAIVAAGTCFLLFPLRLAVEPPAVTGGVAVIFDWFRGLDQPYNLCPSLHIALRTILAATYARHLLGISRVAAHVWFSLIGFSTLLTYQHHVVDVAGGFVLAAACFYVFSAAAWRQPVVPNFRIAALYGLLLAAIGLITFATWPCGAILLWPTAGLVLSVTAYCGVGPAIYRKASGRIPWPSRLLMAPLLAGQYLSWLHYKRQSRAWDSVLPGLWIGRMLTDEEARGARAAGVTAVLDLTAEVSEAAEFRSLNYFNLQILDLSAPTDEQIDRAIAFIGEQSRSGIVYVHCKAGYSRTASIAGAYLLACGQCDSAEAAMQRLRECRPSIVIRPEAIASLERSALRLRNRRRLHGLCIPDPTF